MISLFAVLFLTCCSFLTSKARVYLLASTKLALYSRAVTSSVVFIKPGFLSLTFIKVSSNLAFLNEASSHSNWQQKRWKCFANLLQEPDQSGRKLWRKDWHSALKDLKLDYIDENHFFYWRLVTLLKTVKFYRNGEKLWTFVITEQFEAGKFYRQQ